MTRSKVFLGLSLFFGGLLGVFFCFYLFIVMMSAMAFSETLVIRNDLGYSVSIDAEYECRGSEGRHLCKNNDNQDIVLIAENESVTFKGTEDYRPLFMRVSLGKENEIRCFNYEIDQHEETSFDGVINLFALRGIVKQSDLSQHPIVNRATIDSGCRIL